MIKTVEEINREMQSIHQLIGDDKLAEAKEHLVKIESSLGESPTIGLNFAGFAIDIGSRNNDGMLLDRGINIVREVIARLKSNSRIYPSACYALANGLLSRVAALQQTSKAFTPGHNDVKEAKRFFRLTLEGYSKNRELVAQAWVNLGNCLQHQLGRTFEALECYQKAVALIPEFSMALANQGTTLLHLARLVDDDAATVLRCEAFVLIQRAIEIGLETGPDKHFRSILDQIRPGFRSPPTKMAFRCKDSLPKNQKSFRGFYVHFCHRERLYLNPLGLHHRCKAAIRDSLIIKKMLTQADDEFAYYRISEHLNQIKQEFVTARFLAAQSFFRDPSIKFIDKGVAIIDTFNYCAYSIHIELAKTAFRLAYSVLDKTAFLVNDYLQLGIKPDRVYFRIFAAKTKDSIRNKLDPIVNPFISAFCDLADDFLDGNLSSVKNLRHAFEHRLKTIHADFAMPNPFFWKDQKSTDQLKVTELRKNTIEMLRLAKATIFYAVLLIGWNEEKKAKKEGVVLPMYAFNVPDRLKGEV